MLRRRGGCILGRTCWRSKEEGGVGEGTGAEGASVSQFGFDVPCPSLAYFVHSWVKGKVAARRVLKSRRRLNFLYLRYQMAEGS